MLLHLSVHNVLLISELDMEFGPGLNVLTGETGAGKSILLDALGFVLGQRQAHSPPPGADGPSEVTASFEVCSNEGARAVLEEMGFLPESELVLRRAVAASGRSSAFINDRRCSTSALARLGDALVEIHGQSDDRGLLNSANHRRLLDQFAGNGQLLQDVRQAWRNWQSSMTRLHAAQEQLEKAGRDREFAEHAARELEMLDPKVGEDEELDRRRASLRLFVRHQEDLARAENALGPEGAENLVNQALARLGAISDLDTKIVGEAIDALDRALTEIFEAQRHLDELRLGNESDPREVERVEERLFAIRAAARKHSVRPDQLPDVAVQLSESLQDLDRLQREIRNLRSEVEASESRYASSAKELSRVRTSAARDLDSAMANETGPLRLGNTNFTAVVSEEVSGREGLDRVVFTASTIPSMPPGPINAIASGGELSRFMLALKVSLMSDSGDVCAVFDEIDRGVGGATADAVGRRLRKLAQQSQVLVVTHSPQVAAMGHSHWRIEKSTGADREETRATKLDASMRVLEIARMLSGETVTGEAQAAAVALLDAV